MLANQLVTGKVVDFMYDGAKRTIEVEKVKVCGNGQTVVVGFEEDGKCKQFRLNKMSEIKPA